MEPCLSPHGTLCMYAFMFACMYLCMYVYRAHFGRHHYNECLFVNNSLSDVSAATLGYSCAHDTISRSARQAANPSCWHVHRKWRNTVLSAGAFSGLHLPEATHVTHRHVRRSCKTCYDCHMLTCVLFVWLGPTGLWVDCVS